MNLQQQKDMLETIKVGHVIEHGIPFKGIDPDETVCWSVKEVYDNEEGRNVKIELFLFDIYLTTLLGTLTPNNSVKWEEVA